MSERLQFADVIKFRAIQAEFPVIGAQVQTDQKIIKLDVVNGSSTLGLSDSKAQAAAFCADACVFNPNTTNPQIRQIQKLNQVEAICTGIQLDQPAVLSLPESSSIKEVMALAPCGQKIEEAGLPESSHILKPIISSLASELKKPARYDLFGRFVAHTISDYTENLDLLRPTDIDFLNQNNEKHSHALKVALASLVSVSGGLAIAQSEPLNLLALTGSFGMMATFGGAWFSISFASIREEFTKAAIKTTQNMLVPLEISMASTFAAISAGAANYPYAAPFILGPFGYAFGKGLEAIIQFDTSDAFNRGLTGQEQDYYNRQNQVLEAIGIVPEMSVTQVRNSLKQWKLATEHSSHPAL